MLTLLTLIGLLFGQTGVRLNAYIPAQARTIVGEVRQVGDMVTVTTPDASYPALVTRLEIDKNRVCMEAEGEGVHVIAEFEDRLKSDLGYVGLFRVVVEGIGDCLPGRGKPALPLTEGGQAVEILRGGE